MKWSHLHFYFNGKTITKISDKTKRKSQSTSITIDIYCFDAIKCVMNKFHAFLCVYIWERSVKKGVELNKWNAERGNNNLLGLSKLLTYALKQIESNVIAHMDNNLHLNIVIFFFNQQIFLNLNLICLFVWSIW